MRTAVPQGCGCGNSLKSALPRLKQVHDLFWIFKNLEIYKTVTTLAAAYSLRLEEFNEISSA
jgi:hypothetical protein